MASDCIRGRHGENTCRNIAVTCSSIHLVNSELAGDELAFMTSGETTNIGTYVGHDISGTGSRRGHQHTAFGRRATSSCTPALARSARLGRPSKSHFVSQCACGCEGGESCDD